MIKRKIADFFKGNARTVKAKKNILASLFIKGGSILIGFILVPITLDYLDQTRYGIWLTISSFLTWFTFFEVGLGSGLRNKLAEALAVKNYELGKVFVSTTYAILSIVVVIVATIFFSANVFIDWTKVLNTDSSMKDELSTLSLIIFGFFFLRFVLKLIGIVLIADQRPAINNIFGPSGNLLSLIVIFILTKTTKSSLIYLGITLSVSPIIILGIASIYFYSTNYKRIAPSFNHIKWKYGKELFGIGFKFFLIQVSALVIFQTSNIIISQFFGPAEVTPYNITYKYFSVINMLFTIIITPFWSAHTEAWVKKDINWIKNTVNNLIYIWFGFVFVGLIMFFFSDVFFRFWIGGKNMNGITISKSLSFYMMIYFLIFSFGGIFNMFINGTGMIKLQTISLIIGALLFFPLTIIFIKVLGFGIEGVVIAILLSNFYSLFIAPVQYYKIINNNANGIWRK